MLVFARALFHQGHKWRHQDNAPCHTLRTSTGKRASCVFSCCPKSKSKFIVIFCVCQCSITFVSNLFTIFFSTQYKWYIEHEQLTVPKRIRNNHQDGLQSEIWTNKLQSLNRKKGKRHHDITCPPTTPGFIYVELHSNKMQWILSKHIEMKVLSCSNLWCVKNLKVS